MVNELGQTLITAYFFPDPPPAPPPPAGGVGGQGRFGKRSAAEAFKILFETKIVHFATLFKTRDPIS